jgi:hypothetical protein
LSTVSLTDTIVRRDAPVSTIDRTPERYLILYAASYTDELHYRVTPDPETGDSLETDADVSSMNDPADEANAPKDLDPTRDELEAVFEAAW